MIVLQAEQIHKTGKIINNVGHLNGVVLELVVLSIIFGFQLYFFIKVLKEVKRLKQTFNPKISIEEEYEIPFVHSDKENKILKQIKRSLNNYLEKNFGSAVNFNIIKDIIDRELDVEIEGIQQQISTPLYLGLAATMSGIILGLWAMPDISSNDFSGSISVLIQGVKWAMLASLVGLLFTTILSTAVYKPAIQKLLRDKSSVLSFLQANLLPKLTAAEETGILGLKRSLDDFSSKATSIVKDVGVIVSDSKKNILAQKYIMDKVENLDLKKLSQGNLLLFSRLEKNLDHLESLSSYLTQMEDIAHNLYAFGKSTQDIQSIARTINQNVEEATKLNKFLFAHFEKLNNIGNQTLKAVDLADMNFSKAVTTLTDEAIARLKTITEMSEKSEVQLKDIFNKVMSDLDTSASKHIDAFTKTYSDAVPKFRQLDKLSELEHIKRAMEQEIDVLRALNGKMDALIKVSGDKKTYTKRAGKSETKPVKQREMQKFEPKPAEQEEMPRDKKALYGIGEIINTIFKGGK